MRRLEGCAANAKSAVHALDIRSRKVLSECMASAGVANNVDPKKKGAISREVNTARRSMLDAVKEAGKTVGGGGGGGDDAAMEFDAVLMEREAAFVDLCRRVSLAGGGDTGG